MDVTIQVPLFKRLPSWLYKVGAQTWIDYQYPRHLFIETTASCNLTCSYCPREARSNHMDFNLFRQVVDEATHYGPRSFSLHLFGEPTFYPYWVAACHYIKQSCQDHRILLTTNGTTLNRRVDDLLSSQVDLVLWTWRPEATFTPETKEKLRQWGKFRVRFIHEITPPEAYTEWANWPNVEGRQLHNYGGNIVLKPYMMSSQSHSGLRDITNAQNVMRWPCYHLWLAPAVAWNGDILLCCADPHHKEVLGHFPHDTVASIWRGSQLAAVRASHMAGQYKGICATCDVWKQYPDLFFAWQKRTP